MKGWRELEVQTGELADVLEWRLLVRVREVASWLKECVPLTAAVWEEFGKTFGWLQEELRDRLQEWLHWAGMLNQGATLFLVPNPVAPPNFALVPEATLGVGEAAVLCLRLLADQIRLKFARRKEAVEILAKTREALALTSALMCSLATFLQGQGMNDLWVPWTRQRLYSLPRAERSSARDYLLRLNETHLRTQAVRLRLQALERARRLPDPSNTVPFPRPLRGLSR